MSESPYISAATASDFSAKVIERSVEVPVLVDFWAEWCGPCRSLAPVLNELVEELDGTALLVTVDTDQEMELAGRYGVRSLPTVKLFRNGEVVDEFMGALPASRVKAFLDRHIERAPDPRVEEAEKLTRDGDLDGAAVVYRRILEDDPKDYKARTLCARVLLESGDTTGAAALLDNTPLESANEPDVLRLKALLDFHRLIDPGQSDAELEAGAAQSSPAALRELAARKVLKGDYDGAMSLQLELLRTNRGYADNAARRDMLQVFELADDAALVNRYRREMANLLY